MSIHDADGLPNSLEITITIMRPDGSRSDLIMRPGQTLKFDLKRNPLVPSIVDRNDPWDTAYDIEKYFVMWLNWSGMGAHCSLLNNHINIYWVPLDGATAVDVHDSFTKVRHDGWIHLLKHRIGVPAGQYWGTLTKTKEYQKRMKETEKQKTREEKELKKAKAVKKK